MHSGWFVLNFTEADRQITDQNIEVIHLLYILTREYLQIGGRDRLFRDNKV